MQLATLKTEDEFKKISDGNPYRISKLFTDEFFENEDKNYFVSDDFWVDASDIGQQPGHFVWQSDGTRVDAALWESGWPDSFGAGKETCGFLRTANRKLFDTSCSSAGRSFICQVAKKDLAS